MHQHELSVMKMTLSSHNMSSSDNNRSVSPTSSPRSSPRPSPKPQTKRDHSPRSDIYLSTSYKELLLFNKNDVSPMTPFADFSLSSGRSSVNEFQTPDFNRSESIGGSSSKDNNNKKEGKSKKKTAWFSVLYPTYKSRSEDFKQTFKDAPDDERLVVDYSCALQKEILVQGRLYVSQNYFRFYANIFGWETSVSVKWKDVTAITKEKTALVIPNAVLIATRNDKFFFTSFVARDKTYLMLFRVWQNALMDRPMNQQEMWQLVHDSYGAELGLTSDDEDYIAPGTEDEKLSGRMSIESYSEECASNADGTGCNDQQMILEDNKLDDDNLSQSASDSRTNQQDIMSMNGNGEGGGVVEIFQQEVDVAGHSNQQLPTDLSDTTESDHDKDKTVKSLSPARCSHDPSILDPHVTQNSHESNNPRDPSRSSSDEKLYPVCSALHKGKQLMNEVISLHVDKLFTLLFTSSKFFLDFHEGRKTTDLKQTLWSIDGENIKSRVINLTVALNQPVGPKTAQVTEKQVMLPCSKAGFLYAIDVETVNAGIPYADSFCILVHYCIHRISDTQSSIAVYGQIKYKKSVWGLVKTMIEKNCWQGLEDFFTNLSTALIEHSKETISITVKRKSRRRRRPLSIQRPSSEEIEPRGIMARGTRTGTAAKRLSHLSTSNFIVFAVLVLLIGLNFILYYKLQSLEDDAPPYSIIDLHVLKDPPKSHDDWIKLLQKQEALHTVEMQKWQKVLRTAIKLLKQTEESLNELQRSIHPTYTNKIMSIIENHRNFGEQIPRNDDDDHRDDGSGDL